MTQPTHLSPLLASLHDLIRVHALPRSAFDGLIDALQASQAAQDEERAAHARAIEVALSALDVRRSDARTLKEQLADTQEALFESRSTISSLERELAELYDDANLHLVPHIKPLVEYLDSAGELPPSQRQILDVCVQLAVKLLDKNRRYGNSALEPVRIFSKASAVEQILVRLDDKLSRLSRGAGLLDTTDGEDVVQDLIGYLVLLTIALKSAITQEVGTP